MQTRTLFALLATGLLVITGAVAAQADTNATDRQTDAAAAGFAMKATPAEIRLEPGAAASLSIVFEARTNKTLTLHVRAPEGVAATLSQETLDVSPGAPARLKLTIGARTDAARAFPVVVTATDEEGHHRDVRIAVHMRPANDRPDPSARPEPGRPEPRPEPSPARIDARVAVSARDIASFEQRADRLELRMSALLDRIEKLMVRADVVVRADRPDGPSDAPPTPGARMALSEPHAILPAAGGKVALLLAGGEHDARVHLAVRANETSGWQITLEQEIVSVRAHERAWIWIDLNAREDAGPLEYAIVQVGTPGPSFVRGYATTGMA